MDRTAVFAWAKAQFGSEPEYLWRRNPSYAVLRNDRNRKWYAAVMNLPKDKLHLRGEGFVDVLNLKCDPLLVGALRQREGFFPAYHMNKENWVSILLDGAVTDAELKDLIALSYALSLAKKG